jgi:ferritin
MRTILTPKMETALNKQVNAEFWSAYLYLSMSYNMKEKGFNGIASWFSAQAKEEFEHAKHIMDYIVSVDGKVNLLPIEEVQLAWNSPKDVFENTLMHEKIITEKIHVLMDLAIELKDYASQNMLKWFIDEQIEEEDTVRGFLQALKIIDGDKAAMYLFDKKLGERVA